MGEGHGLDFSPDGQLLAVGGGDARVYVFAATGATPPFALYDTLAAHTEPVVGAVAWSPDGTTLASSAGGPLLGGLDFNQSIEGNDDTVRLWAREDGQGIPCASVTTTTSPPTTTTLVSTTTNPASTTTTTMPDDGPLGPFPGFGHGATGGAGHPVFTVTNATDAGPGSLRDALAQAARAGGGVIHFPVAETFDISPGPKLVVPANTTIDARGSHVTLWGGNESFSDGVLNVWNSNVIIAGLRVRNGRNDGIQVAPKNPLGQDISDIVIDHCSVTRSADGGIDVTGRGGHTVSNITIMRTFIAGSGRHCYKGLCGGGSLFKYGATRGSYYANYFFSNLERAPLISAAGSLVPVVADLCFNIAAWTQSSSMSIRTGASGNVIGNVFVGPRDGARLWLPATAYFGGGNTDQNPAGAPDHLAAPVPVPAPPSPSLARDAANAGAQPLDAIDACYMSLPAPSFASFVTASCDTLSEPPPSGSPGAARAARRRRGRRR
jgi:hypothetical protein